MITNKFGQAIHSALTIAMILPLLVLTTGCASDQGSKEDEAFLQKYEAPQVKPEHTSLKFYFPGTEPKNWPKVRAELEKRSLYAVPSLSPSAYCTYLMVDDALYKKYKISEITSLEQYEAYLKAVRANNPDLVPGVIANGVDSMKLFARAFDYVILDEFQNLVYKWDDPKMTVKAWEQMPEFLEASNKIADWYAKGGYPALPAGQDFNNRTYLYWDGNWALRNIDYAPAPPKDAYGAGLNTFRDFLDKYSEYAPHGAFYPDYGRLKDMAGQRSKAIQQFEMKLSNGKIKDPAEVSKFINDMKQLGIDNMVAEIQAQLNKK